MLDNIGVSHWSPQYWKPLVSMMQRMLAVQEARGSYIAPTMSNAENLVGLGMQMAEAGDPCLVALHDGAPVAFIMWGNAHRGNMDTTKRVCNTMGAYTEPPYRHKKISELLRLYGYEECVRLGYELIDGSVWTANERGMEHFKGFHGARVLGQHLALDITQSSEELREQAP